MPIVSLVPNTQDVEDTLAEQMNTIRQRLKLTITRSSGFPPDDILVGLQRCIMRDSDPDAADFVLRIETCPHEELEQKSNDLLQALAADLMELGLTDDRMVEGWIWFLPGPWCLIHERQVVDTVNHPRTE